MTATEEETQMGANSIQLESPSEPDQRGLMEELGSSLDPTRSAASPPEHTSIVPSGPGSDQLFSLLASSRGCRVDDQNVSLVEVPLAEQDQFVTMLLNFQRGRMDEQRCSLDPTPKDTSISGPSSDEFFTLLASIQGRRLDDQRMFLAALPGIQNGRSTSQEAGQDSDRLYYIISKAQSSRMDEQRCFAPHIIQSFGSASFPWKQYPGPDFPYPAVPGVASPNKPVQRSASFSPASAKDSQEIPPAEQDQFSVMINRIQRGRMDEQRCSLGPTRSTPSTPRSSSPDADQGRRPGGQLMSPSLAPPGVQNGKSTSEAGRDSDRLCYIISKAQSSRMDEQRCFAPHIVQSSVSPSPRQQNRLPTLTAPGAASSNKHLRRSVSTSGVCGTSDGQNEGSKAKEVKQPDHLSSRAEGAKKEEPCCTPQITLTEGTPVLLRKGQSKPASQHPTVEHHTTLLPSSCRDPPRSASFSLASEYERMQNPQAQVTLKLSMSFSPQLGRKADDQACSFPEIVLTLGTPGESKVIPLSPKPGRPLSVNLNLVPIEGSHSRPSSPSLAKPHTIRRPSSPHRDALRRPHPSLPQPKTQLSPFSPEEDYFSLIQRVHTAQIQKAMGQGDKGKVDQGKGKIDPGTGNVKGGGKKGREEGGRKR